MEVIEIIIILFVLIVGISLLAYFIYDYTKYKTKNDDNVNNIENQISTEATNRLANVKFVVDQQNSINSSIYNAFTASNNNLVYSLSNVANTNSNILSGLNAAFQFSSNNVPFNITKLPGVVNPNMKLMQNVISSMNLTIQDLNKNGPHVMFCADHTNSRCISLPDNNGDTIIRNLDPSGKLILRNNDPGNGGILMDGAMSSSSNFVTTGNIGIGTTAAKAPLDVYATPGTQTSILNVTGTGGNSVFRINSDNTISVTPTNASAPIATLTVTSASNLSITPATGKSIVINGNLNVSGNIQASGTLNPGASVAW